jgi:hypothetical protein
MADIDIFTKEPIKIIKDEHIFPRAFGGSLVSTKIVDGSTNDLFGRTCEKQLIEAHNFFLNALEIESRRGKLQGRAFAPAEEKSPYRMGPGLKPELKKAGFWETPLQDGMAITLQARTPEEALMLLQALEKKHGIKFNLDTVMVKHRTEYVREPIGISLALGGEAQLAAIGKMSLELAAFLLGNEIVLSNDYDELRSWAMDVAKRLDKHGEKRPLPEHKACSHDYRSALWEGVPLIENAPFQHRIQMHSGARYQGVWVAVELFGHFRYSCVLSTNADSPSRDFTYLVDQVTGRTEKLPDVPGNVTTTEIAKHAMDLAQAKAAVQEAFRKIQEKQEKDAIGDLIEDAIHDGLPGEGEVILPEHAAKFSHIAAERFVRMMYRVDEEKEIPLRDLLNKEPEPKK